MLAKSTLVFLSVAEQGSFLKPVDSSTCHR